MQVTNTIEYISKNYDTISKEKTVIYRKKETKLGWNFQVIRSEDMPMLIVVHFKKVLGQGAEKRARKSIAFQWDSDLFIRAARVSVPKFYRDQKRDPLAIKKEIRFYELFAGDKEFLTFYGASKYRTKNGKWKMTLITERGTGKLIYDQTHPHLRNNPLAFDLLRAVNKLHQKGIVHFDIIRRNLLTTIQGLKLFDFGTAEFHRDYLKNPKPLGTPTHLAPEMHDLFSGNPPNLQSIGFAVDTFGVAIILWGMKHGEEPSFIPKTTNETFYHLNAIFRILDWHGERSRENRDEEDQILLEMLKPDPIVRMHIGTALKRFENLGKIDENLL